MVGCRCCEGILELRRSKPPPILTFYSCSEFDEQQSQENESAMREVLMDLMEAGGDRQAPAYKRSARSFTGRELRDIEKFRIEYFTGGKGLGGLATSASRSISGPWGMPGAQGGERNAWSSVDAGSYMVRGPKYLEDKVKVASEGSLGELVLVDLFEASDDIDSICRSAEAGTVRRLRAAGESRRLFLLNWRCLPIHLVLVWALPPPSEGEQSPAQGLLEKFFSGSMSEAEMKTRVKIIPRPLDMPWVLQKVLGETPAIIGKKIPLEFFRTDTECEVSINVVSSPAAKRILQVLKSAASALNLELALVLEAKHQAELPEQLIGGFHVAYPDLETTRHVAL